MYYGGNRGGGAADIVRIVEITKAIDSVIRAVDSIEQRTILEMIFSLMVLKISNSVLHLLSYSVH